MFGGLERHFRVEMRDSSVLDPGEGEAGVGAANVDGNDLGHAIFSCKHARTDIAG
jgi:hypothetical protein